MEASQNYDRFDIVFFYLFSWGSYTKWGGWNSVSLLDTVNSIIQSNYWHLWYLYAYIAFIITVPFLRKMARSLDVDTGVYLFVLAIIIMGVFPVVEYFGMNINMNLKPSWITYWMFIFPVLGYMIDVKLDIKQVRSMHIILIWILNSTCFICGEISEYNFLLREPGNVDERFLMNFCIVNSVALFLTVKYVFNKIKFKDKTCQLIAEIGKSTFGIYLIHIWILWKNPFYENWINIEQSGIFGQYGGVYVVIVLVFIIAGVLTWTLRRIPIVRKLF